MEESETSEKQIKTVITKEEHDKTVPNGMPTYDSNEPWVQQYIKDFGTEPNLF